MTAACSQLPAEAYATSNNQGSLNDLGFRGLGAYGLGLRVEDLGLFFVGPFLQAVIPKDAFQADFGFRV